MGIFLFLSSLFISTPVYGGTFAKCVRSGVAVLTIDDGVNDSTHKVLDALKENKTPATFFLIGETLKSDRGVNVLHRLKNEQHEVGNHSWSHPYLPKIKNKTFKLEILNTQNVLSSITHTKLFRPPYGALTSQQTTKIKEMKYRVIGWNMDLKDWQEQKSKKRMWGSFVSQLKKTNATKDSIILLLHSTKKTAEMLPDLIMGLKWHGYNIIPLAECIPDREK